MVSHGICEHEIILLTAFRLTIGIDATLCFFCAANIDIHLFDTSLHLQLNCLNQNVFWHTKKQSGMEKYA